QPLPRTSPQPPPPGRLRRPETPPHGRSCRVAPERRSRMKKTFAKKLRLNRETLQHLGEPALREAAGGSGNTSRLACAWDAAPACSALCACTVLECGP